MTNEEALDELSVIYERLSHPENCEQGVYSFRDGDYLEALDLAIKALEEQPTGDLISREALKKAFEDTVCIEPMPYAFVKQIIDNAPTVGLYQGEECVNIKMSEDEIEKFKQMLQERTPLYTITSDTFVEGASTERPTGKWIEITNGRGGHECNLCGEYAPNYQSGREYLSAFCPNCGAKMKGEEE